jgi:hypothetical protein
MCWLGVRDSQSRREGNSGCRFTFSKDSAAWPIVQHSADYHIGDSMNLSREILDLIHFLGVQIGRYPDHYSPTEHSRALVYSALENYRNKHIGAERREEFYTIVLVALQDGEQEGLRLHQQAIDLVEANRAKA